MFDIIVSPQIVKSRDVVHQRIWFLTLYLTHLHTRAAPQRQLIISQAGLLAGLTCMLSRRFVARILRPVFHLVHPVFPKILQFSEILSTSIEGKLPSNVREWTGQPLNPALSQP